jgi:hypothetical protein
MNIIDFFNKTIINEDESFINSDESIIINEEFKKILQTYDKDYDLESNLEMIIKCTGSSWHYEGDDKKNEFTFQCCDNNERQTKRYQLEIDGNGRIKTINKIIGDHEMVDKCLLKEFPFQINDNVIINFDNSTPMITINQIKDKLEIVELYSEPIKSHQPFYKFPTDEYILENPTISCYTINDKIMRIPEFDKDGYLACLVNRYAWGMNIAAAYLDIKDKKLYCWSSYNSDSPIGSAIRKKPDSDLCDLQIFLSNKEIIAEKTIYDCSDNDELQKNQLWHYCGGWEDLNIAKNFLCMKEWIDNYYYKFGYYHEYISIDKYSELLKQEKYSEVLKDLLGQLKWYDFLKQNNIKTYNSWPKILHETILIHNIACVYCDLHQYDKAVEILDPYFMDWSQHKFLYDDEDLIELKKQEIFINLLRKYDLKYDLNV